MLASRYAIIIIIIIIIIAITISFMQGIYTYIPETNHVPKEYNVAAILSLLFMAPVSCVGSNVLLHQHFPKGVCSYYYYYYYYYCMLYSG
jgi:MFS-type transporter involved in bile tolerance (Atg22 family)